MKTLADLEVGDEIVMIDKTGRLINGKSLDRIVRGRVVAAKRVNLTVQAIDGKRTWTVRRDSRRDTREPHSYGWHGYTPEECEHHERQLSAEKFLREQRITIGGGSPWRNRVVELADIIRRAAEPPVEAA